MIRRVVALLVLGATALVGCGPIVYVNEVTRRATTSVEAARAAHAETYAPYWWTRATQYLAKAREVAAYADFQGANRYGELATEAADQATLDAGIAAREPAKRPLDVAPDVAPAKDDAPPSAAPAKTPPAKAPAPAKIAPAKDAR